MFLDFKIALRSLFADEIGNDVDACDNTGDNFAVGDSDVVNTGNGNGTDDGVSSEIALGLTFS